MHDYFRSDNVFSNLFDLRYRRTHRQAVGFYLAYLTFIFITGIFIGGLYGAITGASAGLAGFKIGNFLVVVFILALSTTMVSHKKRLNLKYAFIILLSGVLALLFGGLGGLIPVAYLSTRRNG